jgi:transposase-like protein
MTKPIARESIRRGRVFDAEIIELCVRWYITYRLSYRDLVEMMAERAVEVADTTILRWVTRCVPGYEKRWNRFSRPVGTTWRTDETYITTRYGVKILDSDHRRRSLDGHVDENDKEVRA